MTEARTRYVVSFANPNSHRLDVELRLIDLTDGELDGDGVVLRMASWTPGSYLVRDYARHVEQLEAMDADGRQLIARKIDKRSWRVALAGRRELTVRYRVYAHELTVRTAHVDPTHAFWNGACVYLYVDQRAHSPSKVEVVPPPTWRNERLRVETALETQGELQFLARDLDELLDSPFEVGHHAVHEFRAAGRDHRIAVWDGSGSTGPTVRYDAKRLTNDVARIVETAAAIFSTRFDGERGEPQLASGGSRGAVGEPPYDRYLFVLHLAPRQHGGLEHKSSCVLLESPAAFTNRKRYIELLELFAHEYFHLWNVKRLRPKALGPFDYGQECYTRSLWAMEGITAYYDRLLVRRAGLMSRSEYLAGLGDDLARLRRTPGRLLQSVEAASFDAWIKLYRPDEHTVNSTVSYYLKGSLVAAALDLEIRQRTEQRCSLDTLMGALYRAYGNAPVGFDEDALQQAVEQACGLDLSDFFARYVRGTDELDLEHFLAAAGLGVSPQWDGASAAGLLPNLPGAQGHRPAGLAITTRSTDGRTFVVSVLDDGPASRGGVAPGDELIALEGWRLNGDGDKALAELLVGYRDGETVRLTLSRRDRLMEVSVVLGERLPERYAVDVIDESRRAFLDSWLGGQS